MCSLFILGLGLQRWEVKPVLFDCSQEGDEIPADGGHDEDVDINDAEGDIFGEYEDEDGNDDDEIVEVVLDLNPHRLEILDNVSPLDKNSKLIAAETPPIPIPTPTESSLDPDIVLLSDSWFSNVSSVSSIPTNAPKTVEFYIDNSDSEMIDMTMNHDDDDNDAVDGGGNNQKLVKEDRQPKTFKDDELGPIL